MSIMNHHTTGRLRPDITSVMYIIMASDLRRKMLFLLLSVFRLSSVPQNASPVPPHLSLQLEHSVEKGFGGGWASGNVDVDGDDSVTTSDDRVRVAADEVVLCQE